MTKRETIFSADRVYRYTLWREWDSHLLTEGLFDSGNTRKPGFVQFIALNPSTATATTDDPTIRKCRGFAKLWGYSAMCMTNLFAFRATQPKDMRAVLNPCGEDNQHHLLSIASEAAVIVAAWGTNGTHRGQDLTVRQWIGSIGKKLMCLRKTKDGHPEHPLYIPYETLLIYL